MTAQEEYDTMLAYTEMKLAAKDWHAVWDAAIDLARMEDRNPEVRNGSRQKEQGRAAPPDWSAARAAE